MKPRKDNLFIEFKETSVHVLDGNEGAEFPIEREANGQIKETSATALAHGLRGFVQRRASAPREATCALPARGVTLRTVTLPAAAKEDPRRLIAMQIEAQFPVPPAELAWGYTRLADGNGASASSGASAGIGVKSATATQNEFLVAAIRRDLLKEYESLLSSCGISARFTVAALARTGAAASRNGGASFGLLEIGADRSELATLDERAVPSLRVVNWGRNQSTNIASLKSTLPPAVGSTLYLSGSHPSTDGIAAALNGNYRAELLPLPTGPGITAATHGLRTFAEKDRPILILGGAEVVEREVSLPEHWKWGAVALALLAFSLALRYAEPILFRGQVNNKLAAISRYRSTLPKLDRELSFLNHIKTNQPAYLDTIAVISSAAPPGTRIDQLSIVRRGDVSLRGSIQNPQGPEQFRAKLVDSGFFSKVVVEEQGAAGQDRNKINFRITGVLKPDGLRKVLPPEPPMTNKTSSAGGMNPGMPGGPPPGVMSGPPPGMVLPPGVVLPPGALPAGVVMPPGAVPASGPVSVPGGPVQTAPVPAPPK